MDKKTLYIDFDTIVYSSAAQQQANEILTFDTTNQKEQRFSGKTEFNKFCADNNRDENEFLIQPSPVLVGRKEYAFKSVNDKFANILKASYCDDYFVCIQGSGNFRNDIQSEYVDYKGQRGEKPILFQETFDFVKRKFGSRCIVTEGIETDDFICSKAWESYLIARKNKDKASAPFVIAYCDKDIVANAPGYFLNYSKLDEGVFWVDSRQQVYNFLTQVLTGDSADNIPGLLELSPEMKKLYGVKTRGVGKKTAEAILGVGLDEKTMAGRVVEAYRSTWPYDWRDRLNDNCKFLYLQRFRGDVFDLTKYFGKLGVVV